MLTELPSVLRLGPHEDLVPSNVAPGRWPARVGLNSGEARRSLAGEGRGEGLGCSRSRFGPELGAEGRPAAGFRGAAPCRPREPLLRRGRGHAGD
jgi:hypothetical protein